MPSIKQTTTDLRELAEAQLGRPLASSAKASLWRCPVCPPETYALLMVSANQFCCLGRYPCDGGASAWMRMIANPGSELVNTGETA